MCRNENVINNWGKDHWSTLAYIETLATEHDGMAKPSPLRMRAKTKRRLPSDAFMCGDEYPTRLKDGILEDHDDWDCLNDMVKNGLLTQVYPTTQTAYHLTSRCKEIANQLREHKSNGGKFKTFECD